MTNTEMASVLSVHTFTLSLWNADEWEWLPKYRLCIIIIIVTVINWSALNMWVVLFFRAFYLYNVNYEYGHFLLLCFALIKSSSSSLLSSSPFFCCCLKKKSPFDYRIIKCISAFWSFRLCTLWSHVQFTEYFLLHRFFSLKHKRFRILYVRACVRACVYIILF